MIIGTKHLQPQNSIASKSIAILEFISGRERLSFDSLVCSFSKDYTLIEIIDCLDFLFCIGRIDYKEGVIICLKV